MPLAKIKVLPSRRATFPVLCWSADKGMRGACAENRYVSKMPGTSPVSVGCWAHARARGGRP